MKIIASVLTLAVLAGFAAPRAQASTSLSKLAGPWAATIVGHTGCGFTTFYTTFTLNGSGQGSATTTSHGDCGDGTSTEPFSITGLDANGAGTAHLSCGDNCGWDLTIQVAAGNKVFNLVDVSPGNPDNYIEGTAIHLQ